MRILVTGAGGFIGRHVAVALAGSGHDVVATGRSEGALEPLASAGVRTHGADLATDALDALAAGCDGVVHCAARAAPWGRRAAFMRDNVVATQRLLEAAARANVRRFVHLSSPSIYSAARHQLGVGEELSEPTRWGTAYAETKWLAERLVLDARFAALERVVLRPRAVFGEGDRAIVPRIAAVARNGVFPLIDGGAAVIDVTYVGNVVRAVELALATPSANAGRAYNITNGEPLAVRELLELLFGALGLRVRFVPLPRFAVSLLASAAETLASLRPDGPEPRLTRYGVALLAYSMTLDISSARERLKFSPQISIRDGLERYAEWSRHAAH
jgi:nucleoside-diphosphate-sugar epimerase